MATVYITKELTNRVSTKINSMRRSERNADLPNFDKNILVDASHLFNIGCWGVQHVHLINQIPKDWLARMEDASIHVQGVLDDGRNLTTTARFNGMKSAYARPKDSYYSKTDSELTVSFLRSLPEDTVGRAELLQRWDEAIIAMDIDAKWEKVEKDILEFLKKCKSLNEAVKLFPNVTMYIHSEDMERLNRKVERQSQRKLIVESYDTDGLTAAAIAAKLAEAS
jgi:5S rRNA maturation endonuclease (ribonuclease M5)